MARLRFIIKLTIAFILKFKGLLMLGIAGGATLYLVFRLALPVLDIQRTYIGVVGRYHTNELPSFIASKITSGLTTIDEEGLPVPALAKSWTTPDDGKTWIFHLKESYWHDDSEVTADTIKYFFDDVETSIIDAKTIGFKLQDNFSPFPSVVSSPVFKKGLIGTAEWKVKKLKLNASYVQLLELERSKETLVYKFYPSESSAITGFKLGEVDMLVDLNNPGPLENWPAETVEEVILNRYVGLFFNNNNDSLGGTDKKSMRQALSYALNKVDLGSKRAISPVSPNSWAFNPQVKDYEFDLDRAKGLLGNSEGKELKLFTTPALLAVAEKVSKNWAELGITTDIGVAPSIPSEFDVFLAIYDIPKDPDQYSTWHSTQIGGSNFLNYQNARIDKLLEEGRLVTDKESRKKIYLDFQRFLLEDAPAVFLYHPTSYTVTRN